MLAAFFKNTATCLSKSQHIKPFSTSSALFAEPPRKKRRVDPAILKVRVERKMKKCEREIAKLESQPKQPIPILEYELTNAEIRKLEAQPQHDMEEFELTPGKLRAANKLWSIYRWEQSRMSMSSLRRVERAQSHALRLMQKADNELYNETIAVDDITLIPYSSSHVRRETSPNINYTPPDGHVKNVSREWVM